MVASCHRRSGDYQLAFEIYRMIHADFPDNVECLRYLVHICDDLGKKDQVHEYVVKLRKAERSQEPQHGAGAATPNPDSNPIPSRSRTPTPTLPLPLTRWAGHDDAWRPRADRARRQRRHALPRGARRRALRGRERAAQPRPAARVHPGRVGLRELAGARGGNGRQGGALQGGLRRLTLTLTLTLILTLILTLAFQGGLRGLTLAPTLALALALTLTKVVSAAGVDEDHFADVELDDALLPS